MINRLVFAACLGVCMTSAAVSGSLQEAAGKAETALAEKKGVEAVTLMRQALVDAWGQAPLAVETAIFVSAPADGYGIYNVRPDNIFPVGEPIRVYLEPLGFEWKQQDGLFQSLLTVDFELSSPDGKILAGQKGFGRFDFKSHVPNTEYMANLTLNLDGAPAADYVLGLTVNDEYGGGSASVELPFSIK